MRTYPTRIDTFFLGQWGSIRFKQWLHGEPVAFTQTQVIGLTAHIPPSSFAIDIGAYTGDTAIPMALATGPAGLVLAFEPGPASYPLLLDNIALNPTLPITAVPLAVTSTPGQHTFVYVDPGYINGGLSDALVAGRAGCGNFYEHSVEGVSLTDYLNTHYASNLHRLSYVKIDTEGHDKEILKANADFFRHHRPAIEVEVYPFLTDAERKDLRAAIAAINYRPDAPESAFHQPPPAVVNVLCLPN